MEQILSILLPCCFGDRHARTRSRAAAEQNERTPLLADGTHASIASGSTSVADGQTETTAKRKRRPQSILPAPVYDQQTLKTILDDLAAKLVDVNAPDTLPHPAQAAQVAQRAQGEATQPKQTTGKYVTPVHSLRVAFASGSLPQGQEQKLVDIWPREPEEVATQQSQAQAKLSYSAALKRGAKKNRTNKRAAQAPPRPDNPAALEQSTFNALTQLAADKPLVHNWFLDDSTDLHPPS